MKKTYKKNFVKRILLVILLIITYSLSFSEFQPVDNEKAEEYYKLAEIQISEGKNEQAKENLREYLRLVDNRELLKEHPTYVGQFQENFPTIIKENFKMNEILEILYLKAGIDLKEELEKGVLFILDGKYKINRIYKGEKTNSDLLLAFEWGSKSKNFDGGNIEILKFYINVTNLNLSNHQEIKDYTPLKYMKYLENLDLRNNNITDLSFIKEFSCQGTLKELDLYNNPLENIEGLGEFVSLEQLLISDSHIKSTKEFINLKNMKWLSIHNKEAIKSLNFVGGKKKLKELGISATKIESLKGIENYEGSGLEFSLEADKIEIAGIEDGFKNIETGQIKNLYIDKELFDEVKEVNKLWLFDNIEEVNYYFKDDNGKDQKSRYIPTMEKKLSEYEDELYKKIKGDE